MTTVTSMAQLNAAIVSAAGVTAPGTVVTITLGNNISLGATAMQAINLQGDVQRPEPRRFSAGSSANLERHQPARAHAGFVVSVCRTAVSAGRRPRFPSGVMRSAARIHAQWKVNDFGGSGGTFATQMNCLWKESAWLR